VSDLAVDLAEFAASLTVPEHVLGAVETNVVDTLACALAGSTAAGVGAVRTLVAGWGGAPEADLWFSGRRYPAHQAAWANGGAAHAHDFDDTLDAAPMHAGVSAVPAAVAAGQLAGCTGAELLAAVAAGLEVNCRLAAATGIDVVESGFIHTALLGHFGATAAAGRALGLTADQLLDAFGIVYSSAAGNFQVTRDASHMKRLQPGLAAQAGVVAAQLARHGVRGAQRVFEGESGLFRVYLRDEVDAAAVRAGLGEHFRLLDLSYKPYPSCRHTHSAVDAALALRAGREVESITVGVSAGAHQMVGAARVPDTLVEAQFSIPYAVAAAWVDGGLGLGHFRPESLARADLRALAGRVRPYVHAEIDETARQGVTPAALAVTFADGSTVDAHVDLPTGHPARPMSAAALVAKVEDCAAWAGARAASERAAALVGAVSGLAASPDLAALGAALGPV
jgi:2-methylcitrate dehydratase PrpD